MAPRATARKPGMLLTLVMGMTNIPSLRLRRLMVTMIMVTRPLIRRQATTITGTVRPPLTGMMIMAMRLPTRIMGMTNRPLTQHTAMMITATPPTTIIQRRPSTMVTTITGTQPPMTITPTAMLRTMRTAMTTMDMPSPPLTAMTPTQSPRP